MLEILRYREYRHRLDKDSNRWSSQAELLLQHGTIYLGSFHRQGKNTRLNTLFAVGSPPK